MAKYKKIPKEEQKELDLLKSVFDNTILIAKQKLQLAQIHQIKESEKIEINNSFTFTGKSINFVVYNSEDEEQSRIVEETIETCNALELRAYTIKNKYGYENIRSMNTPKKEDLFFFNDELIITLSVNQSRKIRPFDLEKIDEWQEKDYLGFGEFWKMIKTYGLSEFLGFSYIAKDIRVKVQNEKQFSLNNGVFIGLRGDQKINLNLRVNRINSLKRQDYLGDSRTFFTIKSKTKKTLSIYAKNEHPDTKKTLETLEKLYKMNFDI